MQTSCCVKHIPNGKHTNRFVLAVLDNLGQYAKEMLRKYLILKVVLALPLLYGNTTSRARAPQLLCF